MKFLHAVYPDLYLVDLDLPLTGFRQFISCWILRRHGQTVVVDPGPASTASRVAEALKHLGIEQPDFILLTHIHLDHAGGAGQLVQYYPQTSVFVHPIGIPHLSDPKKLWDSSLKVLGEIARAYGRPVSVPAANLFSTEELQKKSHGIHVYETPGHASHHVCYAIDDLLFAGEVAGVFLPVDSGSYMRIATPPVFKYTVYRNSLLKAAEIPAKQICFGHYGLAKYDPQIITRALQQLDLWMSIIGKFTFPLDDAGYRTVFNEILQKDPTLQTYRFLPDDIQSREKYFCLNSIKGMHGYILKNDK